MAKKKQSVPEYGTVTRKGTLYYRTRITDADGKQVSLYATTCEELYEKQLEGRRQVEEIIFRRKHPTVAEYCEKWLLMQSAKVSTATIKGYRQNMKILLSNLLSNLRTKWSEILSGIIKRCQKLRINPSFPDQL